MNYEFIWLDIIFIRRSRLSTVFKLKSTVEFAYLQLGFVQKIVANRGTELIQNLYLGHEN